jgi:hypothetical protein
MDELLIKYCKENGYIYIDYSYKFVEFNDDTINQFEDLMNKKRFDDKYAKVVFRINFEKINENFVEILENYLEAKNISNKSLFITKYISCTYRNDILLTDYTIKSFFIDIKNETCCICLEGFEHRRVSCCYCSATYHYKCIEDDNYQYSKGNKVFCCICKNKM